MVFPCSDSFPRTVPLSELVVEGGVNVTFSQFQIVATAVVAYVLIWLFTIPPKGTRTNLYITYLHLGIRLKHFWISGALLTPVFSPHINAHHLEERLAPEIDYISLFALKMVWIIAGLYKAHGTVSHILYVVTGSRWLLAKIHSWAEARAVAQCERQNKKGFTKAMKIPEYDWKNGSPEEFHDLYVKNPKPVILRKFSHDTKAVAQWKFEAMLEKYGEEEVVLTKREEDGFLGKLKEVDDPKIYLHNCEVLFNRYPQLMKDLALDRLGPYIQKGLGYAQLFIGRQGTGTPFHCAGTWNWFNMLDGEKTWYFIDPEYSYFAYPFMIIGNVASFMLCLYPEDVNTDDYPLWKWCPYYKATLQPGDVLLNPPWWWHAIRNITPTSVAVASRWHGDGGVGRGFLFTSENYNINRLFDWGFFVGVFKSVPFLHSVLGHPSPTFDEHMTLREKNNRFTHRQREFIENAWKF